MGKNNMYRKCIRMENDETPYISEIRKKFYKKILKMRYEMILKVCYEELTKV